MITLTVYDNNVAMGTIQVTDSDTFPLALTKSNADVRDITKRKGVYSKNFKILATSNNDRVLKYIYNANATATVYRDCSLSYNNAPILTGKIQVVGVKQTKQADEYDLVIYSDNVDWYFLLNGKTIRDYDYGNDSVPSFTMTSGTASGIIPQRTATVEFNQAFIEASWDNENLFDYVYPLISYGQPDLGVRVGVNDMRPAIYIGKMLTKAFANIGYTLDSDFFNTGIGNRLILPFTGGGFIQDTETIDDNSFVVARQNAGAQTIALNAASLQSVVTLVHDTDISGGGTYNNTTGLFFIGESGNYVFSAKGSFVLRFLNQQDRVRLGLITFSVGLGFYSVNVTYNGIDASTQSIDVLVGQDVRLEYEFTTVPITLQSGSTYDLDATINIAPSIEYFSGDVRNFNLFWLAGSRLEMQMQPEIVDGQEYEISRVLPDLKVLDILAGLQNMFNLYFETNNDGKTISIEPKPVLLKPTSQGINYSQKLDVGNQLSTEFISEYNRYLRFRFAEDSNDKWQEAYNSQNGGIFGSVQYDLGTDFKEGFTETGTKVFAATLLYEDHPFSPNGCPIPVMWNQNSPSPPKSYEFLPRVLYYRGYETILLANGQNANWKWLQATISKVPTSFMLDPDTADLTPLNILYGDRTNANGLVRTYYNSDVAVIADKRVHRAYFKITSTDFYQLDLYKPIFIDHVNYRGWYYINQVIDFKPNKEETTIFELVKAYGTLPFTRPIATEIPTLQGGGRQLSSLGGGTLTAGEQRMNESAVLHNGSGNVGIIRGGGVIMANGGKQSVRDQHIYGSWNFPNEALWVVGAGRSDSERLNALQMTRDGRILIHGGEIYATIDNVRQNVTTAMEVEGGYEISKVYLTGNR